MAMRGFGSRCEGRLRKRRARGERGCAGDELAAGRGGQPIADRGCGVFRPEGVIRECFEESQERRAGHGRSRGLRNTLIRAPARPLRREKDACGRCSRWDPVLASCSLRARLKTCVRKQIALPAIIGKTVGDGPPARRADHRGDGRRLRRRTQIRPRSQHVGAPPAEARRRGHGPAQSWRGSELNRPKEEGQAMIVEGYGGEARARLSGFRHM